MITITKAKFEELNEIEKIYDLARKFMKESGNPNQWKNNHPSRELLEDFIKREVLYVVKYNNKICASFACILGEDETYKKIEGAWLSDTPYVTIHAIASDKTLKGVFGLVLNYIQIKYKHIRIDTHNDNKIMQHLILKNGFKYCGIIYVADLSPRLAYEKI